MVEVFREVWRVLRPDGTVWLNLGDSYATGHHGQHGTQHSEAFHPTGQAYIDSVTGTRRELGVPAGLKPKDLVGIPWRVAFALQADGWYLRSDIIWSKPNPMPESVTDRPTKSHEYLFLLTKAERYFYDADAIREQALHEGRVVKATGNSSKNALSPDGANDRRTATGFTTHDTLVAGRNRRTVWEIATQPYPEAHFATFPTKLVEPCVLAGTSERGCCPECGAPWERVVERNTKGGHLGTDGADGNTRNNYGGQQRWESYQAPATTGWRPTCGHADDPVPCVVLDPFGGSGTVAEVAYHLGRDAVIVDVKPEYLELAKVRLRQGAMAL
jgi:DNA modification methylase